MTDAARLSRPVIGVTGPARGGHSGWGFTWLALRQNGARVRRLRPPYLRGSAEGLDAIVIGGGAHIEPKRYAQLPAVEYVYDEARDEFEWAMLEAAMVRSLPVLGICRGAQLLNVFAGGTLYQNLPEDIPGLHLRRHVLARKRIAVNGDSLLARVMGVGEVRVNSLHMQGVRELGAGFQISARDASGVVQAIESVPERAQFLLGVQWHPEYLINHAAHRRLFRALVAAARRSRDPVRGH